MVNPWHQPSHDTSNTDHKICLRLRHPPFKIEEIRSNKCKQYISHWSKVKDKRVLCPQQICQIVSMTLYRKRQIQRDIHCCLNAALPLMSCPILNCCRTLNCSDLQMALALVTNGYILSFQCRQNCNRKNGPI